MSHTFIARLFLCVCMLPFAGRAADSGVPKAGLTVAAEIDIPGSPVASREQLDAYLHKTPPERSPLSWLTPGGQRRFLASIVFGEHGVGGIDIDDLSYDLTREQAYVLLRLFGVQSYAISMDARTTRRAVGNATPAALEVSYDRLIAAAEQGNHPGRDALQSYADNFAALQSPVRRKALDDRDLEFLFRASAKAFDADVTSAERIDDLRKDLAELDRRHLADRPYVGTLYDALLRSNHADEARSLLAAHPLLDRRPPPLMRTANRIRGGQPSVWVATPGKRELVRFRFNIHAPSQVIVTASTACPYCENAARDIEANILLRDIFRDYAQWVASSSDITDFDALQKWNRAYPNLRFGIAYDNDELPMVKHWNTPTFYFLDHGLVVATVVGWPDGGNLDAIRQGLRRIDLMR